jgi:small subunit ribosomal protein S20
VANKKSAEKRIRQTTVRRARNRSALSALRTAVKKAREAVDGKSAEATALVKKAVASIDKAVTKGVLKRETASRYISRLSLRANKAA